jgi:hypothetical protein
MRIHKLAIAALIAAVPTAAAFAQSAQSVPRVSPTTEPRVSPTTAPRVSPTTTSPTDTSGNMGIRRERGTVTTPPATTGSDVVRDPRPINPGDTRAIGAPMPTR